MSARTLAVCARIPVSPNVASSSRHCLRRYHRAQNPLPGSSQSFAAPPSRWLSASRTPSTPRVGSRHRGLHTSAVARHGHLTRPEPGTGIRVHFKDSKGNLIKTVEANEGDDVLGIAHEHDIDLEGACEGSVACSTCHVIVSPKHYDLLPEPEDDENDMLDMAFGLTDTSRLGCQVHLTRELDGITCTLPSATRNMFVDGHKSTHH
ncbi:ferredoxin [Fomitopsis betulina]|nr:ferredoxin [Fomitopsis betulina]